MRRSRLSVEERFWRHVDQSGGPDACWPWLASKRPSGYGQFCWWEVRDSPFPAHRVAYRLTRGEWPDLALHVCDNRECVNPSHIVSGTQADNMRHAVERRRLRFAAENGQAKLTSQDVAAIRSALAAGASQRSLARHYGVANTTIYAIAHGRTWVTSAAPST
jgi:DNA-binding XRE family transcriptional regulator